MLSVSATFPSPVFALDEPELYVQYNPKELGVDKRASWFAGPKDPLLSNHATLASLPLPEVGSRRFMDYTDDACNVAAHGVIESISAKYTMFLPDGPPCSRAIATNGALGRVSAEPDLRSVTVPKLDGSSKDSCALTPAFRPNQTGDGTTQLMPAKMPANTEIPNLSCWAQTSKSSI